MGRFAHDYGFCSVASIKFFLILAVTQVKLLCHVGCIMTTAAAKNNNTVTISVKLDGESWKRKEARYSIPFTVHK